MMAKPFLKQMKNKFSSQHHMYVHVYEDNEKGTFYCVQQQSMDDCGI
jgi:hypothetical protein